MQAIHGDTSFAATQLRTHVGQFCSRLLELARRGRSIKQIRKSYMSYYCMSFGRELYCPVHLGRMFVGDEILTYIRSFSQYMCMIDMYWSVRATCH